MTLTRRNFLGALLGGIVLLASESCKQQPAGPPTTSAPGETVPTPGLPTENVSPSSTAPTGSPPTTPASLTTVARSDIPTSISPPSVTSPGPALSVPAAVPTQAQVSLNRLSFTLSWHAGRADSNGNPLHGTELMRLLPYKGKLYASNSLWMESDKGITKACQLMVLNSPDGRWGLLHQFSANNLRLTALQTVSFSVEGSGSKIEPVAMLMAATDNVSGGAVQIYSLDDEKAKLVPMDIGRIKSGTYASTRAIGSHRDAVTGIDRVFAGNDILGLCSGVYDPSVAGRIKWQGSPELTVPSGERVMGFAVCNGALHCATSRRIFKREDGSSPSWQQVYYCPQETNTSGIRGLTTVPDPSGKGEVLLFAALGILRHLAPSEAYRETVELDMKSFLGKRLNASIAYVLSAYNDFLPYTLPTGETVHLFGFEAEYAFSQVAKNPQWRVFKAPSGYFAAEGRYFVRRATGGGLSFDMGEVDDPALPDLVSVRSITVSPFPSDNNRAFYFGGFDCNSEPSHDTAWIYRAQG